MTITLPINLPSSLDRGIGEVKLYVATYLAPTAGVPNDPPATGSGGLAYVGAISDGGLGVDESEEFTFYECAEWYGALAADRTKRKGVISGAVKVISREALALFKGLTCTTSLDAGSSLGTIACTRLVSGTGTVKHPFGNPSLDPRVVPYQWVLSLPAPSTSSASNLKRLLQIWKGVPRKTGAVTYSKGGYAEIPFEITALEDEAITAAALTAAPELSRFGRYTDATT